jgi:hypothetical protein
MAIDRKTLKQHNWMIKRLVVVYPDMFYSDPYQSLRPKTMLVLQRFLQKQRWDKKTRKNIDEDLIFTYTEAKALGISKKSFQRAIEELVMKGFIKIAYQGGKFGSGKDFSRYRLVNYWALSGTSLYQNPHKIKSVNTGGFDKFNAERAKKDDLDKTTVIDDYVM